MLRWNIGLYGSIGILTATLITAFAFCLIRYRKKRLVTPNRILFFGTFLSALVFFGPIYLETESIFHWMKTAFLSAQNAFRLFVLDADYLFTMDSQPAYPTESFKFWYAFIDSVLHFWAPILTFGFILSFFKNLTAHLNYLIFCFTETHIFSELNEKTLALAKDLTKDQKRFLGIFPTVPVVFTDVLEKKEELSIDLIEDAQEIGAILFHKDLESVKYRFKHSFRKVNFYLISEDESEKLRHAQSIMEHYDYDENVKLYIFSDDIRCELLLEQKPVKYMDVTLVNDIQSLIYHNLYENGHYLFERARRVGPYTKVISVIIVGLGKYGREMLKALTWFCQLNGSNPKFVLKINVFDTDVQASKKFAAMCPELMEKNGKRIAGDAYYDITIHDGIDVATPTFEKKVSAINDATYIFVSLGDDKTNLSVATNIRSICERTKYKGDSLQKPDIETVIYDSNIHALTSTKWDDIVNLAGKKASGLKNFKGDPYYILTIGDLKHFYSEETVIGSALIAKGKEANRRYGRVSARKDYLAENILGACEWKKFLETYSLESLFVQYLEDQIHHMVTEKPAKERRIWRQRKKWNRKWQKYKKKEPSTDIYQYCQNHSFPDFCPDKAKIYNDFLDYTSKNQLTEIDATPFWQAKIDVEYEHNKSITPGGKDFFAACDKASDRDFRYKYNHRSSVTKAIHEHLREQLSKNDDIKMANGMPIPKTGVWEKLTDDERLAIGTIEHVRWNAYMRTEGYCYAKDRQNLAKQHPNLVPVHKLTADDLRKDA